MSEPVNRHRQAADFEDFDTRVQSRQSHDDDPLAELARLVGETYDPYQDVFAQEATPHAQQNDYLQAGRREPEFGSQPAAPRFAGDFASIEAGLRGALSPHSEIQVPQPDAAYQEAPDHPYVAATSSEDWMQPERIGVSQPEGWSRRRPVYLMAATIAVGVIGIGAAFALKGHATSPGEVKTILADAGPTKIQPPVESQQDHAAQDAGVLSKTTQPAPTQLVSREEQPVDIGQAVRENIASRGDQNAAADVGGFGANAANVPVPPSPDQMQKGAKLPPGIAPDQTASFGIAGMPEPKRVKVVSVRPDGTILPNDQPPAAAEPAPRQTSAKTSDRVGPVAKASTPKTTSRVPTTPKTIASALENDGATTPKASQKKPKLQRMASADTGGDKEATEAAVAPTSASHGGFAVQLAAPGSEADAKSAASRLAKKFSSALSGHHLAFHKASSNGHSVYRVRVSSLSKDEAVGLCEKLKANGGTCFVAKN